MKRASIKDVAALAGCSTATVSLALRGSDKINPTTREKVLRAAAQLNYRPNLTASRLSSKRSKVVGIILLPILHDAGLQMLYGITEQLQAEGFSSLIEFTGMSYEKEVAAVKRFIDEGVDGVLVNSAVIAEESDHLHELQRLQIPFVQMDLMVPDIESSYVGIRNEEGAYQGVKYLLDTGHRRIACVGRNFNRSTKKNRRAGYARALTERGLPVDPALLIDQICISLSDYILAGRDKETYEKPIALQLQKAIGDTRDVFRDALIRLFDRDDPPTAFFTVDSGALVSLLWGLGELNLQVPEDVSVVTFEGVPFLSPLWREITTVSVPAFRMGYEAARLLVSLLEEPAPHVPQCIELEPEILHGDTVVPPREIHFAGRI